MKNLTDKQKRIIAYIIAIWFAVFGAIGMVQTILQIASCNNNKSKVEKVYAQETDITETTTFNFNLANIYKTTTTNTINKANKKEITKRRVPSLANLTIYFDSNIQNVTVTTSTGEKESWTKSGNTNTNTISFENNCIWQVYTNEEYIIDTIKASNTLTKITIIGDNYFTGTYIAGGEDETLTITSKKKTTPTPTTETKIEQSTQNISFTFTATTITIQIYNNNRETTYISQWNGTQEDGWNAIISSYNTKPIDETTIQQYEGFQIHISPQNISSLTGQIQPTYIPTQAECTIYKNQIKYKFGRAGTTEESEYIQIQINNTSETSIKFIPENTTYQYSINETGYADGYNKGYKQGTEEKEIYGQVQYNKGKQDGIASANKYTFKGLISAVFDVPIQTIWGMLNYNILGVNILTLITSIISLVIIIAIIRKIT